MNTMNHHKLSIFVCAAACVLAFAGCTFQAGYNPSYLPQSAMKLGIPGKVLVVLEVEEEQRVFAEHPKSFTAGATTLELPLGEITKQVALKVFSAAFEEGGDFANDDSRAPDYRLVVKPRVARLDYYYNQAKNLGFAITPQVEADLSVTMVRRDGTVLLDKIYSSGRSEGDTYVVSGSPQEKVNKLVHLTLFKLATDAAVEMKQVLERDAAG